MYARTVSTAICICSVEKEGFMFECLTRLRLQTDMKGEEKERRRKKLLLCNLEKMDEYEKLETISL